MTVATKTQPNYTTQAAASYKAAIDGITAIHDRIAGAFAPHEQNVGSPSPDLSVRIDAGFIFSGVALTEVAAQTVSGFTTPSSGQERIDRVVIDIATGTASRVAGTAVSGSPSAVAPSIPAGKMPCCQILFTSASTAVLNSMITDERVPFAPIDLSKQCGLFNGSIAASVSANALTLAIKTFGGDDPTPANPVLVAFRDATVTGGTVKIREITAALSMTISAGSTLGFTTSESGRIYAGLIDNAGTVELCAWNPLTSTGLRRFSEESVISTTAEGGAGAADTAGTIYSTTARSNVALRYAGYIDIQTGATAGNWSNAPTVLVTMGPGVARTGDILQTQYTEVSSVSSGTTTVPLDNTIPQNTEGTEFASLSITPNSALSRLLVETEFNHVLSVAVAGICCLFKDSEANAYQARTFYAGNGVTGAHIAVVKMGLLTAAVSATSQTWKYRAGPNSGATIYINADNVGGATFNGTCKSTMKITEIQR